MNESIEFEDYEPADLVDPEAHAHHHTMCYKDRCRFEIDLEELHATNVDLLKRIETLERIVKALTNGSY
jgi:hypothetical protein